MNIFKTFETFLKEPLSILKENFIQIVSVQTGNLFENKPSVDVSVLNNKTQLTVVNNEKMYKLFSTRNFSFGVYNNLRFIIRNYRKFNWHAGI